MTVGEENRAGANSKRGYGSSFEMDDILLLLSAPEITTKRSCITTSRFLSYESGEMIKFVFSSYVFQRL
jgi:hypothetical protein